MSGVPFWIEVDAPIGSISTAAHGVWTTHEELVGDLEGHPLAAGPAGSGLPGAVIGSMDDLRRATDARFLLLNGEDAAGSCGKQGLFILMQAVADDPRPVWIRGAVGPALIAAARELGFAGVLAEEVVWPGIDALPQAWRDFWQDGSPGETRVFGPTDRRVRFWARPGFSVTRAAAAEAVGDRWADWAAASRATPERPGPKDAWLPAGGASGLAGRLGITGTPAERLARLNALADGFSVTQWPWRPGAGWATAAGTALPLSQGPMANVSDVADFARVVANAGAFPWFALASTPPEPVQRLLNDAADLNAPWGSGIIGMTTNPMLEEHIRLCREAGVRWLLVAAGTTSLAARLIQEGFEVVMHTPAPEMLDAALAAGVRHVIWEGREAGGHVGTLNSWTLWQHNLAVLEAHADACCSVLLAGGVGTAASARLTAPLGARLEQLGHAQGLQIGSAYLRTREAVASGAIAGTYATALQQTRETVVAGDQSGAPTRLLATTRALELTRQERDWIRNGIRTSERKHHFEKANFGGLRLAAKAERVVIDDQGPRLERVADDDSLQLGLFHIGENAALPLPDNIQSLHDGLTSPPVKQTAAAPAVHHAASVPDDAIAIIGMSFWLPGAADDESALWQMLADGRSAIDDIGSHAGYWNPDLFWDPDGTHPEKAYSRIGAFIDDVPFDGRRFRIPPRVAAALDRTQLLGLILAERAFADAGLPDPSGAGHACDVVLGIAQGDLRVQTDARILLDALALAGGGTGFEAIEQQLGFSVPEPVADSMAGELGNCCAGRIASAFDLHGANFTADAACASALAAISQAVDRLRLGRCDIALTGGIDRNMSIGAYVKFCRLGALSREGSFPFDARASGFVMGEGGALFVLKRLRDARRDGDRIRAVIRGTGLASDGRGKGITAPNPAGQQLAVERAWKDAGIGPDDLGYIEAHGTGTPVGDKAETTTLRKLFSGRRTRLPVGSIKGNIGHLKAAAGAAGLAKTVLMLEQRAIAPSGGYAQPRPELGLDATPLYVADHLQDWDGPLRAGISAFGFGGTNAHIVVEAASVDDHRPGATISSSTFPSDTDAPTEQPESSMNIQATLDHPADTTIAMRVREIVADASGYDLDEIEPDLDFEADLGIDTVKIAEIIGLVREAYNLPEDPDLVLSDVATVAAVTAYVTQRLGGDSASPGQAPATEAAGAALDATTLWRQASTRLLEFRAETREALADAVARGERGGQGDWALIVEQERFDQERLTRGLHETWPAGRWQRAGACFGQRAAAGTAWLFPGQGTQRPGMLSELRGEPVIDETIAEAAAILDPLFDVPLETLLATPASEADAERIGALLRQTRYTQPVLLTVEIALMRLLNQAGWQPGAVAGHSLGEFGACVAAGVLSFRDALRIVSGRGRAMEEAAAQINDPGAMVAVGVDRVAAAELLRRLDLTDLELANQNSPTQTVIGGATALVDRLCDALASEDIRHKRLNVSHAFHTSIVAAASAPLRELLASTDIQLPRIPIYSNVTARPYPDEIDAIRELLSVQLARPVRFVEMIEDMAAHGVPGFVEVGAGRVLSGLAAEIVEQTLPAVPSYLPGQDAIGTLARVYAVQESVA
ncbi:MAG: acyltransferase domain-containing protein, partial [Candidatus Dadabacteria bacterium]